MDGKSILSIKNIILFIFKNYFINNEKNKNKDMEISKSKKKL